MLAIRFVCTSLPGLELDGERVMSSDHALSLDHVPESVIVLGGGVIGVEFASVWRSFGAEVTVVEALPRLVPTEDEACSKALERAFRKRGIAAKTGAKFESVERTDQGVRVTIGSATSLEAESCSSRSDAARPPTASASRRSASRSSAASCSPTNGCGPTSPASRPSATSFPGCSSRTADSSRGSSSPRRSPASTRPPIDETGIPRVTYCEPEVASVGLTEAQATERYGEDKVETFTYDLAGNGKSQILKTQGFVKVVREKDGPVSASTWWATRVGELVGEAQLIYNWEAFPAEVAQLVHAHPTQNEALGEAHLALAGKPLHAHG